LVFILTFLLSFFPANLIAFYQAILKTLCTNPEEIDVRKKGLTDGAECHII